MPCLPGFLPVAKVDQDGPDVGGIVLARWPVAPSSMSFLSVGKWPASAHGLIISSGTPSSPMVSTFCERLVKAASKVQSMGDYTRETRLRRRALSDGYTHEWGKRLPL